jgi:hypothetical protein
MASLIPEAHGWDPCAVCVWPAFLWTTGKRTQYSSRQGYRLRRGVGKQPPTQTNALLR